MARLATIRSTFFLKILSWDKDFRTRDAVATLLDQFAYRSGHSVLWFSAPRQLQRQISLSDVPSVFKPEINRNSHDFLFDH